MSRLGGHSASNLRGTYIAEEDDDDESAITSSRTAAGGGRGGGGGTMTAGSLQVGEGQLPQQQQPLVGGGLPEGIQLLPVPPLLPPPPQQQSDRASSECKSTNQMHIYHIRVNR